MVLKRYIVFCSNLFRFGNSRLIDRIHGGIVIKRWILFMYIIPISYLGIGFTFSSVSASKPAENSLQKVSEKAALPVENFDTQQVPAAAEDGSELTIDADTDLGLYFFRQELTSGKVLDFYSKVTGSTAIAGLIIEYSSAEDIPLPLAFSLAWAESGFNPRAVNENRSSVDRGLFQLNSRSFPKMTEAEFFNPRKNTAAGLKYLKYCLNVGGNEVAGLAMYNAGRTRVTESGAPKMTLDYVSKILKYSSYLHDEFENEMDLIRLNGSGLSDTGDMTSVRYLMGGETYF